MLTAKTTKKAIKNRKDKAPVISVLMPVYNAEKYLETAVNSIFEQTYKNYELIIINDGSTDRSLSMIKNYSKSDKRIIFVNNVHNMGTSTALNIGLAKARGKYMIRMDADDYSYPDRFEKQYKYMESNPEVVVSGGYIEVCNERLEKLNIRKYPLTNKKIRSKIFLYSPFAHPATIWRTDKLVQAGGYNENFPIGQDYELYFRIGLLGKFGNIGKVIHKLRIHNSASSLTKGRAQEHYTLYARIKGFLEYGYQMSFFDKLYSFFQLMSSFVIPPAMKFKMFNYIRKYI